MKKRGLQRVPWLVMHICWLKGDYEVGYFLVFFLGQLLVFCLEFSTKFALVNQPLKVLGSPFIFTPSVTMKEHVALLKKHAYASMETSIYASRAGDEVLPFEQFFTTHKTLHLNSLKCPFVVVYSITFQLCIATQLSACYNIQEPEWWFWLSLSLHLPVFYIISLTASVHVSPFSCLFSFSTG